MSSLGVSVTMASLIILSVIFLLSLPLFQSQEFVGLIIPLMTMLVLTITNILILVLSS